MSCAYCGANTWPGGWSAAALQFRLLKWRRSSWPPLLLLRRTLLVSQRQPQPFLHCRAPVLGLSILQLASCSHQAHVLWRKPMWLIAIQRHWVLVHLQSRRPFWGHFISARLVFHATLLPASMSTPVGRLAQVLSTLDDSLPGLFLLQAPRLISPIVVTKGDKARENAVQPS